MSQSSGAAIRNQRRLSCNNWFWEGGARHVCMSHNTCICTRGESAMHYTRTPAGAVSLFARDTALHLMQFESRGRLVYRVGGAGGRPHLLTHSHTTSSYVIESRALARTPANFSFLPVISSDAAPHAFTGPRGPLSVLLSASKLAFQPLLHFMHAQLVWCAHTLTAAWLHHSMRWNLHIHKFRILVRFQPRQGNFQWQPVHSTHISSTL